MGEADGLSSSWPEETGISFKPVKSGSALNAEKDDWSGGTGRKVPPVEPAAGQRFRHMGAELAPLQLAYLTEPEGALLLQNAAAPTAVTERRARQEVEWEHQASRQRFMFSWDSKKERKTEGGLELPNRRLYRKEPTAFPTIGVIQT